MILHNAPLQTTRVIHDQLLERSLLLLGAAAGVEAITPTLTPGDQVGGANLNVEWGNAPRFCGNSAIPSRCWLPAVNYF